MSLDGFTDERILILNYTENLWRCAHWLYSSSICVFAHCDNLNLLKFMRFNANLNVAGWVNVDLFIKLNFFALSESFDSQSPLYASALLSVANPFPVNILRAFKISLPSLSLCPSIFLSTNNLSDHM